MVRSGNTLGVEHKHYHDHEYGFPLRGDNELFERLVLEINQAGLSWTTILRKRVGFQKAYEGFALERVAAYTEADEARLLADADIIRNRLKVKAASENARRILEIRKQHGSFAAWLDAQQHVLTKDGQHPLPKEEWVKLFRKTFVFTGGEIVGEFLLSTGYLPGAHDEDCPVYRRIGKLRPAWMLLPATAR